jgi:predicted HTH transcriptional regulator
MLIEELLIKNEGKTLEFKENVQSLQGILKTIVAFANTAGGTIVIGIEDKNKKIVGVKNPLAEEERLASVIYDSITPAVMPDIEIQTYHDKELIIVNVPHIAGPCYIKSAGIEKGTFVRFGSTNRLADAQTILSLKNLARNVCYDETPDLQGSSSDLDWDVIQKVFQQEAGKKLSPSNAQNVGIMVQQGTKEVPTYGGIILFGKNRLKMFPEAIIRCACFLGLDRETLHDRADIDIYLPLALEEAMRFIQRNTRLSSKITSLRRIDIPQYPLLAVREAIVNAIVHADYSLQGVYISIAIFEDRIEITSPGSLPFGFTLERALAGSSRIRNRIIAKVFYHLKWIEQWGRGLQLIVKECEKAGLKKPLFEEINNQFRVTLYSTTHEKSKKNNDLKEISDPWEKTLITKLKKKKAIGTKDAAQLWDITPRSARVRLLKLVKTGIIKETRTSLHDPHGKYVLASKKQ